MKAIRLLLCAALTSSALPASAIELSLEENRAERGSVGYVDMQRLFKASPDASRAREGLEELVRQAEERVNGRKVELLKLRQELSTLKIEREELAKSTPTASVAPAPAPKPAPPVVMPPPAKPLAPTPAPKPVEPPKPAPKPAAPEPPPVTAAPPQAAPAPAPLATPELPQRPEPAPLTINLPGLTDGPLNLERPGSSPLNPTRAVEAKPAPAPEPAPAPAPAPAAEPAPPPAPAPTPEPAPAPVLSTPPPIPEPAPAPAPEPVPAPAPVLETLPEPVPPPAPTPTVAQRLLELDGLIVAKQAEIDRVQAELDKERLAAERSLLDAEGRKTDQVLARLYRAISEVAKREGVSVVVDKPATLYGHPAVDLTDKVLRQLRGAATPQ